MPSPANGCAPPDQLRGSFKSLVYLKFEIEFVPERRRISVETKQIKIETPRKAEGQKPSQWHSSPLNLQTTSNMVVHT